MKITLVGRPDKVIERGPCVITILQVNTIPALPKGIPAPAPVVTPYAVYIRVKQWRKVAQVMTDPEDASKLHMSEWATNCVTHALDGAIAGAPAASVS